MKTIQYIVWKSSINIFFIAQNKYKFLQQLNFQVCVCVIPCFDLGLFDFASKCRFYKIHNQYIYSNNTASFSFPNAIPTNMMMMMKMPIIAFHIFSLSILHCFWFLLCNYLNEYSINIVFIMLPCCTLLVWHIKCFYANN